MADNRNQRKISNYLLDSEFQLKYWLFVLVLIILVYSVVNIILFHFTSQLMLSMAALTKDAEVIQVDILAFYKKGLLFSGAAAALVVIISFIGVVFLTHKIVGPIYALNKHIDALKEGDYTFKTKLRKGDELKSLAQNLNELTVHLKNMYGSGGGRD